MTAFAASPFEKALDAVLAPLEFCARDDFARMDRVRGLGEAVRAASARALALAIPEEAREALRAVESALAEPASGDALRERVLRALDRLRPLRAPGFGEGQLAQSVSTLPGVGPKRTAALASRGLASVADLLFLLPSRYDDRRSLDRIQDLEVGRRATFVAAVERSEATSTRRGGRYRRVVQAVVGDGTGRVTLVWFRGGDALEPVLQKGARLLVTGDVTRYRFSIQIVHPDVEPIGSSDTYASETGDAAGAGASEALDGLRRIVPEYPLPEGMSQRIMRRLVAHCLAEYADLLPGHLPEALVRSRELPAAAEALREVHAPAIDVDLERLRARGSPAHARLVMEELYLLELGLALRHARRAALPGTAIDVESAGALRAVSALPFGLTDAQARAFREIRADLARSRPMNRLLQGDVGSGKTAVAWLAAAAVCAAGRQAAFLAPTELLAEQHARTLSRLAAALPDVLRPRIALLTASLASADARAAREAIAGGEVDLALGTHSLLQGSVRFSRLALVVVDEQHRFGVRQRAALTSGSGSDLVPHTLVMTATPIPRTLALTLYGDLDLSVIDALPPGRAPARTLLLRAGEGARITALLRETVARGEQVYVVYPLVEERLVEEGSADEGGRLDLRAAQDSAERLRRALPELSVDLVHGRLDAAARGEAMARFERGETQVLVSTSVIEVGVDVPNATLMIVEHAERFGLAQLHQLRGRVGRGGAAGTCVLVARGAGDSAEARLRAMLATTDGFEIADADLRIRGPGEFLGTRQHGHLPDLKVADLIRDARLLAATREAALQAVRSDPGLSRDPGLRRAVEERWGERLSLAAVG